MIASEAEAWATLTDLLDQCRDDPIAFNDLFLARPPYWSRQAEIARSVVRFRSTVVYTGNMTGKDWAVGGLVPWWLLTRPDSLLILTGPSQTVIGSIAMKEVRRALDNAVMPFGGRISRTIKASPAMIEIASGWHGLGFSTTSVERASGQHSGNLLVIVEEASGVEDEIWDAIDSLGYERLLAIGNPIRAEGRFVDLIRQADRDRAEGIPDGEAVNAIRIPSTESPHATWDKSPVGLADRPWIDGMRRRYGPRSLWARAHIDAEIPAASADTLIPADWLDRCLSIPRDPATLLPGHAAFATRRISCDLGEGIGRDSSCVLVRDDRGILDCVGGRQLGPPEAAAEIARMASKWGIPPQRISYDRVGVGRSLPLHLSRHGLEGCYGYAGAGSPLSKDFTNLRTEAAWKLRSRLDPDAAPDWRRPWAGHHPFSIPAADWWPRLRTELGKLTYSLVGKQVQLLPKDQWKQALGYSPDTADCALQSFAFAA